MKKKAIPNISNPDELNKHLQRTSPSTWVILGVIIAFLVSFFGWTFFGSIPIKVSGTATLSNGEASLVVPLADKKRISLGQKVSISDKEGEISTVNENQIIAKFFDLPDGEYFYSIFIEMKHPISFLTD